MHLHYVRNIAETRFGLGLGYERIFDIHGHNMFGVETIFRPTEALSLNLSPGLTFEDEDPNPSFALHLETAYEFELKKLHIGPSLELARDPDDSPSGIWILISDHPNSSYGIV